MNRITVKPKNIFGNTIVAVEIGTYSGMFKWNATFPVTGVDKDNTQVLQKDIALTQEEYDNWTDDTVMEDLILGKLDLERE